MKRLSSSVALARIIHQDSAVMRESLALASSRLGKVLNVQVLDACGLLPSRALLDNRLTRFASNAVKEGA